LLGKAYTKGVIYIAVWCLMLWQIMTSGYDTLFGIEDSHNVINVLQRSPVFERLVKGHAPPCTYEVNGHKYNKRYFLADSIYRRWLTFAKKISDPLSFFSDKERFYYLKDLSIHSDSA
jgi:hypothetical protein